MGGPAPQEPQDPASTSPGAAGKGGLPNRTNLNLRPPEVAARIVRGLWEGDLIKDAMNSPLVGTLVGRIRRNTMLVKFDGNTEHDVLEGFKRQLKSSSESPRKTMTYDRGSEMALRETLSAKLKIGIYFSDPHSRWRRGSNENAYGLVRERRPKGLNLSQVSHQQLTHFEHLLNHRPRKTFNFCSTHEIFSKLASDFIAGVVLQV